MTYAPPEGVTIGTFTADALPATFRAPANSVVTYKIYGSSEGEGVETENKYNDSTTTDNYRIIWSNGTLTPDNNYRISDYISVSESTSYTFSDEAYCIGYDANKTYLGVWDGEAYKKDGTALSLTTITIPSGMAFIRLTSTKVKMTSKFMAVADVTVPARFIPYGYKIPISNTSGEQQSNYDLFIGSTKLREEEYLDYGEQKIYRMSGSTLVPTDPPAPLPAINTYKGENTLSSTETLGEVEFTGEWSAIMGSTQAESIDIGFTVDAEEYIAFATIDDGPSIQVSDTITMPSSADSFTLDAVAWGREQYTDTVYNALS